jgi:hypothetical protein
MRECSALVGDPRPLNRAQKSCRGRRHGRAFTCPSSHSRLGPLWTRHAEHCTRQKTYRETYVIGETLLAPFTWHSKTVTAPALPERYPRATWLSRSSLPRQADESESSAASLSSRLLESRRKRRKEARVIRVAAEHPSFAGAVMPQSDPRSQRANPYARDHVRSRIE